MTAIEQSDDGRIYTSDKAKAASVSAHLKRHGEELDENDDCELYYYVSIRFNKAGAERGQQ